MTVLSDSDLTRAAFRLQEIVAAHHKRCDEAHGKHIAARTCNEECEKHHLELPRPSFTYTPEENMDDCMDLVSMVAQALGLKGES